MTAFAPYVAEFRRRFGIATEQAQNLFHQTVSMKSVGNLTDFVREHMLEAFTVEARIDALVAHFNDLHRAHQAVLKAKAQIERLLPLVADRDRHADLVRETEQLRGCREALRPWFAFQKGELLERRLVQWQAELERQANRLGRVRKQQHRQWQQRDEYNAPCTRMAATG